MTAGRPEQRRREAAVKAARTRAYNQGFVAGEQAGLKKHLELLSGAAPLRWVFSQDMDGAREWEVKAAAILSLITDKS